MQEATKAFQTVDTDGTGYGFQWWILSGDLEGLCEARGRGGQAITVWPDANIIAVFTGRWTAPIVFEMAYDEVAGPNHLHIRGDFGSDADSVTLLFTDPAGHFLPQVVPGTASLSCP